MIDVAESRLTVTRQGDGALVSIGLGGDHNERRGRVIDAIGDKLKPLAGSIETHFLSTVNVDGQAVALLCAAIGERPRTVVVRGAFTPERAVELLAAGRGLAPHINEIRAVTARKETRNDRRRNRSN